MSLVVPLLHTPGYIPPERLVGVHIPQKWYVPILWVGHLVGWLPLIQGVPRNCVLSQTDPQNIGGVPLVSLEPKPIFLKGLLSPQKDAKVSPRVSTFVAELEFPKRPMARSAGWGACYLCRHLSSAPLGGSAFGQFPASSRRFRSA